MVPMALTAANIIAAIKPIVNNVNPLAEKNRFNMLVALHLNNYQNESLLEVNEAL